MLLLVTLSVHRCSRCFWVPPIYPRWCTTGVKTTDRDLCRLFAIYILPANSNKNKWNQGGAEHLISAVQTR